MDVPPDSPEISREKLHKAILDAKAQHAEKPNSNSSSSASGASIAMRISTDLLAGVLVGAFIGWWIDKWLESTPWGMLICFFLGVAGAARNIYRIIKNTSKNL